MKFPHILTSLALLAGLVSVGPALSAQPVPIEVTSTTQVSFPSAPTQGAKNEGTIWTAETPDALLYAFKIDAPWWAKAHGWILGDNFLDILLHPCGHDEAMAALEPGQQFGDYTLGESSIDLGRVGDFHTLDISSDAVSAADPDKPLEIITRIALLDGEVIAVGAVVGEGEALPPKAEAFLNSFSTKLKPAEPGLTIDQKAYRVSMIGLAMIFVPLLVGLGLIIAIVRLVRRRGRRQSATLIQTESPA